MQEVSKKPKTFSRRASERMDGVVEIFSPRKALERRAARFAYDAIAGTRTNRKRSGRLGGTGDAQLTEFSHGKLMEISRDLSRNNPLAKGILKTERDGVIGQGPRLEPMTSSDALNQEIEGLWAEYMIDQPIDNTSRFNWPAYIRKMYLAYRRDGDAATVFHNEYLEPVEADQIGTPFGHELAQSNIYNGVVYSKTTGRLIGYYIGKPDKWGYINPGTYKAVRAEKAWMMFDPDRFSQSRGEPALTPSIDMIDKLCGYIDAELIAAKVQACFTVFVSKKEDFSESLPGGYTKGISSTGRDEDGNRLEKVEPGTIMYGEVGEEATPLGMNRPGSAFDPFTNKALAMIGRPLNMPLMLVTLDFSGATFMNAKIAYDRVKEHWEGEQITVVKPFASRVYRWFVDRMIREGRLTKAPDDAYRHRVGLNRWPYVDPMKQAAANEKELKAGTISEIEICERKGVDYEDVVKQRAKARKIREQEGLAEPEWSQPKEVSNGEDAKTTE